MKNRTHKRQILLFLIAVAFPCFILIFSTFRLISQEKELSQKRLAEERQRTARDIGRRLFIHLETLKLQVIQALPEIPSSSTDLYSGNPEVVLLGLYKENSLIFPWELDQREAEGKKLLNDNDFIKLISKAEREEFVDKNYVQAAESYRQVTLKAARSLQKEYARLMLARTLARSKRPSQAGEQYLRLLAHPARYRDENGIPLFLYATEGLLAIHAHSAEILDRLASEFSQDSWFPPTEAYKVRDVLDKLQLEIDDESLVEQTQELKKTIQERIQILEQALTIRQEFPILFKNLSSEMEPENKDSAWIPLGRIPWLLSFLHFPKGPDSLLIAVDQERVLDSLKAKKGFAEAFPLEFSLTPDTAIEGDVLGPNFPGLKALFLSSVTFHPNESGTFRYGFYLLALAFILSIAFFGAYLLWRDIRRDMRMAELRSQFVSSVSHELKTPLTAIRMFAETLRLGRAKDSKIHDEYLETIVNESQRLTRLLNNVLDFSKIEEGQRIYRPEPASLNEIVLAATRAMEYPFSQQGFRLHLHADEELPSVLLDRDAIEQAILNLLNNAMKYSGQSRDIDLRLQKNDGHALIQIIDRGIGIEPHEKERIFEKFYRISSSDNKRLPGTGLGLTLVAHIVKAHGGHIEVESMPGQGSTFSIYLPLGKES